LDIKAKQKSVNGKSKMSIIWDDELMNELKEKYLTEEQQQYIEDFKKAQSDALSQSIKKLVDVENLG